MEARTWITILETRKTHAKINLEIAFVEATSRKHLATPRILLKYLLTKRLNIRIYILINDTSRLDPKHQLRPRLHHLHLRKRYHQLCKTFSTRQLQSQ